MNYSNMIAFRMSYVVTTPALSALGYWSSSFMVDPRHLGAHSNGALWTFSAYNRAGERFWGHMPKLRIIFGEILWRMEAWVYQYISYYSCDVL